MQQNYKYLNSSLSAGQLVDIICGNENRIVFVWKKSPQMNELYKLWCEHKLYWLAKIMAVKADDIPVMMYWT